MCLFRRFLQHVVVLRDRWSAEPKPSPPSAMAETHPEQPAEPPSVERAVERLLEDERLRGDLTDDEYNPLLNVVTRLAMQRGERYTSTDGLHLALRDFLAGAVQAAQSGEATALLQAAQAPLTAPEERTALQLALAASAPSDSAAMRVARALADTFSKEA